MTAPIRTSVNTDTAGSSATSLTSPTLSGYHAHDLLIGAAYTGLASSTFSTYTWSNGDTNTNTQLTPNASPSGSLNRDAPTSGGSTTFGFTTSSSSQLSVIVADLIPANASVSPTVNATSLANNTSSGTGPIPITLGTYTTIANDCILFLVACGNSSIVLTPTGAGATWTTLSFANTTTYAYLLCIGYAASSGQTSFSFTTNNSSTYRWATATFSGVATSGATNTGNMLAVL